MSDQRQITKATGIIGVSTFLSRILGFIRDMVLARLFGTGTAADAFFVAYRIPNMLRELFAEGSMSAAFIPVFSEYLTRRSRKDAWELASAVFTTLLTLLTGITLLGILFSPVIVRLLAPGFSDVPDKLALTVLLNRIMFPYLLFIGLAALLMGLLNSIRSFAAPALSPVMFNLCIILSALFLSPRLETPIVGIAIGVLIGGCVQFLFQLPSLQKGGFWLSIKFQPAHPGVKKIGRLLLPTMIGLSVMQVNILVNTLLASFLSEGSVTYLFYGMRLIHFPLGVFGVALATALLPTMSAQSARGDFEELRKTVSFGLRLVLFITVPAMVGLIFLRIPIVHLLFEHGNFTPQATANTAIAVFYYALGLWAFAGVRIAAPTFYALQDTATPAKVGIASMLINIVLNLILMGPLAHGGLALATALSAMFNFLTLLYILGKRIGSFETGNIVHSIARTLAASTLVGWTCHWISQQSLWTLQGQWVEKSLVMAATLVFSVLGYFIIHGVLKSEEHRFLWNIVKERWARTWK